MDLRGKFKRLKASSEDDQDVRDSYLELLEDVDAQLTEVRAERTRVNKEYHELEGIMDDAADAMISDGEPNVNTYELGKNIEELRRAVDAYNDQLSELDELRADIEVELNRYKVFDKNICFGNIRRLLAYTDVKIGQIEKAAGVRVGYQSRLEKEGSTSDPSIQYIATAAKMLHVSVDELMFSQLGETSPDEKFIHDFFIDIKSDTLSREMRWKKEPNHLLEVDHNIQYEAPVEHPLLRVDEKILDGNGDVYCKCYVSLFYPESVVKVKDGVYSANLPLTDGDVYLVPCYTEDDEYIKNKEFFEAYLYDKKGEKLNPLCCTLNSGASVIAAFNELYKAAMADATSVHIDQGVKDMISEYRKYREIPF